MCVPKDGIRVLQLETTLDVLGDDRLIIPLQQSNLDTEVLAMRTIHRFRRFSIRGLLVVVALLAIATQWWEGTPRQTAERLADAIVARDAVQIATVYANTDMLLETWRLDGVTVARHEIKCSPRLFSDMVMGRQRVELRFLDADGLSLDTVRAEVVRFHVASAWNATPIFSTVIASLRAEANRIRG